MRVLYEMLFFFCLLTTSSCLQPDLKICFALGAKKSHNHYRLHLYFYGNYSTMGQNSGQQLIQHTQHPFWKPVLNHNVINLITSYSNRLLFSCWFL